jgi:hypothetical protein
MNDENYKLMILAETLEVIKVIAIGRIDTGLVASDETVIDVIQDAIKDYKILIEEGEL